MYKRPLYIIYMLIFFLCFVCCHRNEKIMQKIDLADKLIEELPDSSLKILSSISLEDLQNNKEKARYSLLMSMALDKNFIDTTTFDVLQPAIDYYLKKGSPDEKLRTYYYQGVIYMNRCERDKAANSFLKGLKLESDITDSLVLARTLSAQGLLHREFHDYKSYTENYELSAELYRILGKEKLRFNSLINSFNGHVILNNKEKADSIENLILSLKSLDENEQRQFGEIRITKTIQYGGKEDIKKIIKESENKGLNINGYISLASAYNKIGESNKAIEILNRIEGKGISYDTIKFTAVKVLALRDAENYKEALKKYFDLNNILDSINVIKFDRKSRDLEEKYKLELLAQEEINKRKNTESVLIFGLIIFVFSIFILLLLIRNHNTRRKLAQQKVKITESEISRLKTEKEKLILETENMAHRISILEEESEALKNIIQTQEELPEEVQKAIKFRIEILNSLVAGYITDNDKFEKPYEEWIKEIKENTEEFMNSNRLAFQASHPHFIKYFEDHGLTIYEINYVCLYALGLRGKEVGNYMKKRSHVNISSAIRKKLGIDQHETNIGIYVRKLLKSL